MSTSPGHKTSPDFMRLVGNIGGNGIKVRAPIQRETVKWTPLPTVDYRDYGETIVQIPDDYDQPPPIELSVLFSPDPRGIYDIEWIATGGTELAAGDELARGYRVTDGLCFKQRTSFAVRVVKPLVERNRRAIVGDALARCMVTGLSLDLGEVDRRIRHAQLELWQGVNAAFKGVMGALGQGGHIAQQVLPIKCRLDPRAGLDALFDEIISILGDGEKLIDGDVVVLSEKPISIAQARLFPRDLLYQNDPKVTDREGRTDLLSHVAPYVPGVTVEDLILADALDDGQATAGLANANETAHALAARIADQLTIRCDVVIADTDTGAEVRETVIGCPTVGATPLGATAGLVLYECMRVACAAEFVRGSSRSIPIVICRPHERRASRTGLGEARYPGLLDARRERLIGFA